MRNLLLAIPLLMMLSCTNNPQNNQTEDQFGDSINAPDMHNSESALDWNGRYTGVLPCADCEGIETIIYLAKDKTYAKRQTYLGKGMDPIEESGEFSWSEDGGKITLSTDKKHYKVGENMLFALDESGNVITGELADYYRLSKAYADNAIEDITWELVELDGAKRINDDDDDAKAYFILNSSEGRVSGNLGCNNFFGSYKLEQGMRISFGQMGVTMKACPDMSAEQRLSEIIELADNYTVQNDTLSLNKARMAPLAVFKAVNK